jgi:4-hydroxybutyryl-CoA dehydratase/vinylacetyl-CoA-Delta-isomerase
LLGRGRKTAAGNYLIDYCGKHLQTNVTRFPYEIANWPGYCRRILCYMPSDKDFAHPEIGPLVKKYSTTKQPFRKKSQRMAA